MKSKFTELEWIHSLSHLSIPTCPALRGLIYLSSLFFGAGLNSYFSVVDCNEEMRSSGTLQSILPSGHTAANGSIGSVILASSC
jgi:hypothetical protein